jgi:hypothetical protein
MNDMSREWDELLLKMVGILDTNNHKNRNIAGAMCSAEFLL